jgi:hypothetical protein
MTDTITMSSLYAKLRNLGFSKEYIRKHGLPSWWDDELNNKPFAVLEGAGYIANLLNIDLKSLLDTSQEVRFNTSPDTKFKQHNSKNKQHPDAAQALASRIAELIAKGTEVNFTPLPTDVKEIRTEILTKHTTVNLTSLLEYCWSQGIIVAYFNDFPSNIKKFAGLIQWQSERPVIILSSNHKYNAILAFNLAHELGHLALGHLKEGVLVDEEIEFNCNNDEETQANLFATYLLLGDYNNCLGKKQFKNAQKLAKYVTNNLADQYPNIEPEAILLNYGWHNRKYYPLAMSALKELNAATNGQQIINQYLADRLDWDRFNDETYEYLERVLGV